MSAVTLRYQLCDMEVNKHLHIKLQHPIWNGPDVGPFHMPQNPSYLYG